MAVALGIRVWRGLLIAMALASIHPGRAIAQQKEPLSPDRLQSMRVVLVRDPRPDCGPSCAEWIAAQGMIDATTPHRFELVLKQIGARRIPVFVDSPGGLVDAAYAIGRMIKARHLDVVVTRTTVDTCAAGDGTCKPSRADGSLPGHPHGVGSICASACVFVLAAGEKREAASWTGVGVHQIIEKAVLTRVRRLFRVTSRVVDGRRVEVSRTLVSVTPVSKTNVVIVPPRSGYAKVTAYLARMGIGPGLVPLMLATPHSDIHWLTVEEEAATGIVTDHVDGEFAVAGAYAPAPRGRAELKIDGEPNPHVGDVAWTFDEPGRPPAYVARPSLRADVNFAEAALKLALRVDQDAPVAGLPSYNLVLTMLPPSSGPFQTITAARLSYVASPTLPGEEIALGRLTRTAADAYEFTLDRDDLDHLFPRQGPAAPLFTLRLTTSDGRTAVVSFDRTQAADPAIETAMKRFLSQASSGS